MTSSGPEPSRAAGALRAVQQAGDDPTDLALRAFDAVDADPAHLLVVAAEGTQVLGTLQLSVLPGLARRGALRAQVEAVGIRGDQRGGGLGGALLTWAVEEAARRGCALVQLTTDKSRHDAHRFYERLVADDRARRAGGAAPAPLTYGGRGQRRTPRRAASRPGTSLTS